jgi:single-stranded DNA-binding protein
MAGINFCVFFGRLKEKPKLTYLERADQYVADFVLCVDNHFRGSDGKSRKTTTFVVCKAWGMRGRFVHEYGEEGDEVMINGMYMVNKWNGKKGASYLHYMNVSKVAIPGKLLKDDNDYVAEVKADFEILGTMDEMKEQSL